MLLTQLRDKTKHGCAGLEKWNHKDFFLAALFQKEVKKMHLL